MDEEGLQVKEFVEKAMAEIEGAQGSKYAVEGAIDFELAIGVEKKGQSGFNLRVLGSIGGGIELEKCNNTVHRVSFSYRLKEDPDFQVERIVKTKLQKWLDRPNEEILADLQKLNQNVQEKKKIEHVKSNKTEEVP